MRERIVFFIIYLIVCGSLQSYAAPDNLYIENLRCEYLLNPLGIDVVQPRLSWELHSSERGEKQTAWRVLVASDTLLLRRDQGDLWDSGKVKTDQSIQIEYKGKPLKSRQYCYWKVMVWNKNGSPSEWSRPALWSMGLLSPSDWGDARWIAVSDSSGQKHVTRNFGYLSWVSRSADSVKWVTIDLGKPCQIDAVQLYPAMPYGGWNDSLSYYKNGWRPDKPFNTYGWRPDNIGYLFPVRFRIEVADDPSFHGATVVVNNSANDIPNPGIQAPLYNFRTVSARYVRLIVTRLAIRNINQFGFALAEMKVFSGLVNVARSGKVSALDSVSVGGWSKNKLVDGHLLGEKGFIDSLERPAVMVRKEFEIRGQVKRAIMSVTGLGLYEMKINGQGVGDHLLAPEWTHYSKHIQYQTYDITRLLHPGKNAVGGQMAGGWWTGPLTIESPLEDPRYCLLMRLDIEMADGSTQTIVTDSSWMGTADGPIRRSGIYFGEKYDATREMPGWNKPGFASTSGWVPVEVLPYPDGSKDAILTAQCNEPIRIIREWKPVKITEPVKGVYVFDMGQNMAGWCRIRTSAPVGTRIRVRYAEILNQDGTLYTANLRGADQVNEYIWKGGEDDLEPHFTYHGFRYVEVAGLTVPPEENTVTGCMLSSSVDDAGSFECSNKLVNQIMQCAKWTQRSNMFSVPTDCPQRTERFGFLGDIQAFSQTAIFNMDMAGFFTKWIPDICDSQTEEGCFPNLAPHPAEMDWLLFNNTEFAPGWSDAGVIIPWRMYQNYGDLRILQQHYESAMRWVEFIHRYNPDHIWRNNHGQDCSDWLNGDMTDIKGFPRGISTTPHDVFATIFFAHSTEIVSKMAGVLGYTEDAVKYGNLYIKIKDAFNKEFVTADGRIKGDTQGGYALALHFNLINESMRPKANEYLLEAIKKYNNHLSTGIQATHCLMLELSNNGFHDEAWRLINLRTAPSLGYMIDMNATTIWERWDGYIKGRGFQDPNMNSFNHMAFGSVGEWVWRNLAGINPDEKHPGYKHFVIKPRISEGLSWVKGSYNSMYGKIECSWKQENDVFHLDVTIPVNTTATIYIPANNESEILEEGRNVLYNKNLKILGVNDNYVMIEVNSGRYQFYVNNH